MLQQTLYCFSAVNEKSSSDAQTAAEHKCLSYNGINRCFGVTGKSFNNECAAVATTIPADINKVVYATGKTDTEAITSAIERCKTSFGACILPIHVCDTTPPQPSTYVAPFATSPPPSPQVPVPTTARPQIVQQIIYSSNSLAAATIGFVVAILFAVALIFRHAIANFIIHGNLPYKLPVYGEDIQCLFKRTQRVNWYGRVVFGIIVNLAMTHQQLIDVRKYWLGRVIAFDSLRRQRQNELARMHLQLAASAKSDPHDKKKFWSRRWATIRTFIRRLFWIFTALFSFLLSFLFIRVTLAKLIRGTVVESKDLVLILQAKDAIEESTTYLKEYLTTANTFDGGDEIYEPK